MNINPIDTFYSSLPLYEIIRKIVENNDRKALEEFHNNRTIFNCNGHSRLPFIEFISELRETTIRKKWPNVDAIELADISYDITLDKFSNMPEGSKNSTFRGNTGQNLKQKGIDCRFYFKAALSCIVQSYADSAPASELTKEIRAAQIMEGFVRRHFHLSYLEAARKSDPFRSRYNWEINGGSICVWLPIYLKGGERRKWLENNVDDPDPQRVNERHRIQIIIDTRLLKERLVPIKDSIEISDCNRIPMREELGIDFGSSLAKFVAEEKAATINLQRRSIRALGKVKLKQLIQRIFDDITSDDYRDEKVARSFGLSKATFSRFGGSSWFNQKSNARALTIPDLWRNTAKVLAENPMFMDTVITCGFSKTLERILEFIEPASERERKNAG